MNNENSDFSKNLLLDVENLKKFYSHDGKIIQVLDGINFRVYRSERISVMGKSGVGKSTLLHVLGTLDKPTDGVVRYNGIDVFGLSENSLAEFRNRTIGFVFQFHYLLDEFTALENVMLPAQIAGLPKKEVREKAEYLLSQVGLLERITHRPSELSGGEQQRVAIARALVMNPQVVLADEPTGNLDQATSEEIHDLILDMSRKTGTSFIVATHNISLAGRMPRCLRLQNGRIEEGKSQA